MRSSSRFFQVQAVLAILVLVLLRSIHSIDPVYQRCNVALSSDNTRDEFGWETSSCQACSKNIREEEEDLKRTANLNVFIQITVPKLEPQLISIASALLMEQTNVTVFYVGFHRGTTEDFGQVLRRRILSGIPCSRVGNSLESRLVVQPIKLAWNIREYCSKKVNATLSYLEPIQSCVGIAASAQYRLYLRWYQQSEAMNARIPDVLVTDMHGYGALFIAEEFGIPSLVLMDQHSFYETTGQRRGQGTFWHWIGTSIFATLRDFFGTKIFSDINRFRSLLRLRRIRHRSALWNSATAVAVLAHEFNASVPCPHPAYPPILHLQTPIFPPCLACQDGSKLDATGQAETQRNTVTVTVLFLPPHDLAVPWEREITRGLSMARRSLLSYDSTCTTVAGTSNCWHDRIDLQVKWFMDTDLANYRYSIQDPLPSFIQLKNATLFLDSLIKKESNNNGTTIVLAQCDDEARAALLLGIPILCLATRSKSQQSRPSFQLRQLQNFQAREIATKLTSLVWELGPTFSSELTSVTQHLGTRDQDSLSRLMAAIRIAGTLVPTPEWPLQPHFKPRSPKELQWRFAATMQKRETLVIGTPDELSSTYTFFWWISVAIIVLSLAIFTIPHASKLLRLPAPSRNKIDGVLSHCVETWVARFPEVHSAWDSLKKKWKDGQHRQPRKTSSLNKRQSKKTNGLSKASNTTKSTDTLQRKRSTEALQRKRSDKQR